MLLLGTLVPGTVHYIYNIQYIDTFTLDFYLRPEHFRFVQKYHCEAHVEQIKHHFIKFSSLKYFVFTSMLVKPSKMTFLVEY